MPKMFDSPAMRETLRRTVRAEMAYKGLEYRDLSERLAGLGVIQTESNLRSKINNGSLGAQLFMFLLLVMGTRQLELAQVQELLDDVAQELEPDGSVDSSANGYKGSEAAAPG